MEENKKDFDLNAKKGTSKESVAPENLGELLCCSNDDYSINKTEQLSEQEVALLWLRINKNL